MTSSIFCVFCLMLCELVQAASNNPDRRPGMISGHVLYRDGSPVKDAHVEIDFFGPVNIIKPETKTDEKGFFSIAAPLYGAGVVSASKESEGYPNAAIAFYGREGYTSLRRVDITATTVTDEIELRFGEPDATIDFAIQEADTHENLKSARVKIALSDNPDIWGSYSVSHDGRFSFVLPKHPVSITITAPGFADWSYADEHGGGHALLMKPGTHQQRIVLLSRLK